MRRTHKPRRISIPNDPGHVSHQVPKTYEGVGLVLGVMKHSVGSVKADTRWSWSVTKEARKPK